jgi:BirA family transcriptional regulator, biotin operon repressor / biotin---[acetyl-CoA-carboxylase] ligase
MTHGGVAPTAWRTPRGWTLRYSPITGSTNDDAKAAVRVGVPDRTVFLADAQRQGRGRLDRVWVAPPGSSLLFSVVLQRDLPAIDLTVLCSVSVAEAIAENTGLPARIKWPNDVMLGDRKTCGILTEVVSHGGTPSAIVGIGLNVNLDPRAAGLPETATSLSHELGQSVSREAMLYAVLTYVGRRLALADAALLPALRAEWEALLWRRRQRIGVSQDGDVLHGIVEGLSASGALLLRQDDGRCIEVTVGDVLPPSRSP